MSKPWGDPSRGISSGDVLIRPERHPACRRREAQPGSCTERENLSLRCQGRRPSGANRKDQSTEAEHRGGAARSRDEGSVMGLDRRGCVVQPSPRANRRRTPMPKFVIEHQYLVPMFQHIVVEAEVRIHLPPPASHMQTWFPDQGAEYF